MSTQPHISHRLLNNLPGMAYRCRLDEFWNMEFVSSGCLELTGYPPEALIHNATVSFTSLIHPDDRELVRQTVEKDLKTYNRYRIQYRIRTAHDQEKWVWEQGSGIVQPGGNISYLEGFITDISEQKHMESALRKSEALFRLAVENLNDGFGIYDREGRFEFLNRFALNLVGLDLDDMVGHRDEEFLPAYFYSAYLEAKDKAFRTGKPQTQLIPPIAEAPVQRTLITKFVPMLDSQGRVERVIALGTDITELKKTEEALRESEARFRLATDSLRDAFVIYDAKGCIQYANAFALVLLNSPLQEALGKHHSDILSPEVLSQIEPYLNQAYQSGQIQSFELTTPLSALDEALILLIKIIPSLDDQGRVEQTVMLGTDITHRKRREFELTTLVSVAATLRKASNRDEMSRLILDEVMDLPNSINACLALPEEDGNQVVIALSRGRWGTWVGETLPLEDDLIHLLLKAGKMVLFDDLDDHPDQSDQHLFAGNRSFAALPLSTPEGIIGALCIGQNRPMTAATLRPLTGIADMAATALHRIRMLESLEKRVSIRTYELAQANERLRVLDSMKNDFVANVSHELRTPITNIMLFLDLLAPLQEGDKAQEYMRVLSQESKRQANLIENLLTLSRLERGKIPGPVTPYTLHPMIAQVISSNQVRIADKKLNINVDVDSQISLSSIHQEHLLQVLTNLIGNAVAYTPQEGEITVQARTDAGQGQATLHVQIRNSGPLIQREDFPHLFDRFYRGKTGLESNEPGAGLGLAICQEILAAHGGQITVESDPLLGTAFNIRISET